MGVTVSLEGVPGSRILRLKVNVMNSNPGAGFTAAKSQRNNFAIDFPVLLSMGDRKIKFLMHRTDEVMRVL